MSSGWQTCLDCFLSKKIRGKHIENGKELQTEKNRIQLHVEGPKCKVSSLEAVRWGKTCRCKYELGIQLTYWKVYAVEYMQVSSQHPYNCAHVNTIPIFSSWRLKMEIMNTHFHLELYQDTSTSVLKISWPKGGR